MPRRYRPEKRMPAADAKYNSEVLARFINKIMERGKKSTATGLVYDAMAIIAERTGKDPVDTFDQAIRNAGPMIEVKPRRVGGATYQVPVEVDPVRRVSLAMRWLLAAAKTRPGKTFSARLADELLDASRNQGNAIKRREDTHKMAEANKAFAHYRW
ncbi:MAG: 30S ribosomal protein S7 [Chloroflexi bacterium]|nr:30S ribosomal protein S7 [Chloroflexota bacterium]